MEPRIIATACDANYFPALMALLGSLKRTNPSIPLMVFDGGLTSRQIKKVSRLAALVRKRPFADIKGHGKFSYIGDSTLLKFETASLDAEKALFLDADMVVMESLEPLFSFPEGTVGVVPEVNAVKNMFRPKHRKTLMDGLNIDWEKTGFNAGLFALRPAEWRDLKEKALELIRSFGPEVFSKTKDQQLLNLIFSGRTHAFPERYNFSPLYDEEKNVSPAVIHYLTERKPWHPDYPVHRRYGEFRRNISVLDYPPILGADIRRLFHGHSVERRAGSLELRIK